MLVVLVMLGYLAKSTRFSAPEHAMMLYLAKNA
jgi:hypothetical protein